MSEQPDFKTMPKDALWTGTVCGCTKPRGEFYDSWGGKCKEHRKKDEHERRLKRQGGDVKKEPGKVDQPQKPEPTAKLPYDCPTHGPHSGYVVGGKPTKACPICTRAKRDAGLKRTFDVQIRIDLSNCPVLFDAIVAEANKAEMSPQEWILSMATLAIPAETFKAAALRGLKKA